MAKYKGKQAECEAAKKTVKKRIKDWEKAFKAKEGKAPGVEDKQKEQAMYAEYQQRVGELEKITNKIAAFNVMVRSAGWSTE